jgi:hypothetical protein
LSSLPIEEYYVRFEVSTALTMMIIISQKMIILSILKSGGLYVISGPEAGCHSVKLHLNSVTASFLLYPGGVACGAVNVKQVCHAISLAAPVDALSCPGGSRHWLRE